jgi:hypothetical protein
VYLVYARSKGNELLHVAVDMLKDIVKEKEYDWSQRWLY